MTDQAEGKIRRDRYGCGRASGCGCGKDRHCPGVDLTPWWGGMPPEDIFEECEISENYTGAWAMKFENCGKWWLVKRDRRTKTGFRAVRL